MTWYDAKNYCQSKYTNLASVHDDNEQNLLYNVAGTPINKGWIGLHHVGYNWSWTLRENHLYINRGASFMNWGSGPIGLINQCNVFNGNIYGWRNENCAQNFSFVCQDNEFTYFLIKSMKDWVGALEYCRENYLDLANIRNESDKSALLDLVGDQSVWIGFHNRWRHADGSTFTFNNDIFQGVSNVGDTYKCLFLDDYERFLYNDCDVQQPFYCHKVWNQTRHRVKIKIEMRNPFILPDDSNLHQDILNQIYQELSKQAPEQNFTLTWKRQLTEE